MMRISPFGLLLLSFLTAAPHAQEAPSSPPPIRSTDAEQRHWVFHPEPSYETGRLVLDSLRQYVASVRALGGLTTLLPLGEAPEGDNAHDLTYTPSGDRLITANTFTDNVTVIDAETHALLANIPVGEAPLAVAATDEVAVVACPTSNEVFIIDLTTYTVRDVFSGALEPVLVEIMPDGQRALVGAYATQSAEIIDLATGTSLVHIPDFPLWLLSYGGSLPAIRLFWHYNPILITPDGATIVAARGDAPGLVFFDGSDGEPLGQIDAPTWAYGLTLAEDGEHAVAGDPRYDRLLFRVHVPTRTVIDTITPDYGGFQSYLATNFDGSKVLYPTDRGGIPESAIADFTDDTVTLLPVNAHLNNLVTLPGGRYVAWVGHTGLFVADFEAEQFLAADARGRWHELIAARPDGGHFATVSPDDGEAIHTFRIENGSLTRLGGATVGAPAEGDGPLFIALFADGRHALVYNRLSRNAGIFDYATQAITYTPPSLPMRAEAVRPLADGKRALAVATPTYDWTELYLADLTTGAVHDSMEVVSGAWTEGYGPHVLVTGSSLSVVQVADDELTVTASYPDLNVFRTASSPVGRLLLATADHDTYFFDGESGALVATFEEVGEAHAAMSPTGDYAAVFNSLDDTFSVFAIDGTSVTLQGSYPCDCTSSSGLVLTDDVVVISNPDAIDSFDRATGALLGTAPLLNDGVLYMALNIEGEPIVIFRATSGGLFLYAAGTTTPLPDIPTGPFSDPFYECAYALQYDQILYPSPGPDGLLLIDVVSVATEDDPPDSAPLALAAAPNPSRGAVTLTYHTRDAPQPVAVEVFDALGRLVRRLDVDHQEAGAQTLVWDGRDVQGRIAASGIYLIRLTVGEETALARVTVVR